MCLGYLCLENKFLFLSNAIKESFSVNKFTARNFLFSSKVLMNIDISNYRFVLSFYMVVTRVYYI